MARLEEGKKRIVFPGIRLPRLGLGTFRMQGDVCRAAVESALALGYRHIDTAEMYANEEAIGAAIASSGVPRGELHVTTKVWNENLAPDAMRRAFDASLKKLRLDAVDLYLVHWPKPGMHLPSMFETLMKLKEEGRTRAIGVANFNIALLDEAIRLANAMEYGLAAAVWTCSLSRGHRMVRAIRAGGVHVNTYAGTDITVPLGGFKQSGFGRDKSLHALDKYSDLKAAWIWL